MNAPNYSAKNPTYVKPIGTMPKRRAIRPLRQRNMALVARNAISSEYQQGTDAVATGKEPYGE